MPPDSLGAPGAVDYGALTQFIGYALRRAQIRLYEDFYRSVKGSGVSPALFSALLLVERRPAPHDRRAYGLHLTPKGERSAASLRQRVAEHDARIAVRMDKAERQQLMRLLERIY